MKVPGTKVSGCVEAGGSICLRLRELRRDTCEYFACPSLAYKSDCVDKLDCSGERDDRYGSDGKNAVGRPETSIMAEVARRHHKKVVIGVKKNLDPTKTKLDNREYQ